MFQQFEDYKQSNRNQHFLLQNYHMEIVEILLLKGAEFTTDDTGDTPLHIAARERYNDIILKLLQHGANLDVLNEDGMAPIHSAAEYGKSTVVQTLLDSGARTDVVDNNGNTVLHLMVGHRALWEYEKIYCTMKRSTDFKPIHIIKQLIEKGANLNEKSHSVLHSLIYSLDFYLDKLPEYVKDIIKALLEGGANLNVTDEENYTVLHSLFDSLCYHHGKVPDYIKDIIKMLLEGGADPNIIDKTGRTPLDLAKEVRNLKNKNDNELDEIICLLERHTTSSSTHI